MIKTLENKTWSYSSLSSYQQCPYSFYRTYVLGDRRDLVNTHLGQAAHKFAEKYAKNEHIDLEKLILDYKVPRMERADFFCCVDRLKDFIDTDVKGKRFAAELEVKLDIEGNPFVCIMDMVIMKGDEVHIYDYKTSRNADYSSEYQHQIDLYFAASKVKFPGKKVSLTLFYPRVNEKVTMTPKEDISWIAETLDSIDKNKEFRCTPHKWCKSCPYKTKECPLFNPAAPYPKLD